MSTQEKTTTVGDTHVSIHPPTQPDGQSLFLLLLPILISVF
jgi:hypothetical protein